ncbi:MAG: mechanosensitive ion channel family protein [Aureliella sp.]
MISTGFIPTAFRRRTRFFVAASFLCIVLPAGNGLLAQTDGSSPPGDLPATAVEPDTVDVGSVSGDAAIEQRIASIMRSTDWFDNLKVETSDGVVKLSGVTESDEHRDWAEQLANRTEDVVAVINSIEVRSGLDLAESWRLVTKSLEGLSRDFWMRTPFLLIGSIALLLTWGLARITQYAASKIFDKWHLRSSLQDLLELFASLTVWIVGSLIAAVIVFPGMTPSKALTFFGIGSVAIGFAFKDIFENLFAGVLILWRYPLDRGDLVQIGDTVGTVESITVRNTLLRRLNGELAVVPNGVLFKNEVSVLTNRSLRRTEIQCGVAYGEDVDQSREVIQQAVSQCESVDQTQPLKIMASQFGASSIDFDIVWWSNADPMAQRESRDEVVSAVKRALDEAGIEIPFPYRTLTFKEPIPVASASD